MLRGRVVCISTLLLLGCHYSENQHLEDNSSTELYYDYDGMENEFGIKTDIQTTTLSISENSYEDVDNEKEKIREIDKDYDSRSNKVSFEEDKINGTEGSNEKWDDYEGSGGTTTFEPSTVSEGADDPKTTILFSGFYSSGDDSEESTTRFNENTTPETSTEAQTTTFRSTSSSTAKPRPRVSTSTSGPARRSMSSSTSTTTTGTTSSTTNTPTTTTEFSTTTTPGTTTQSSTTTTPGTTTRSSTTTSRPSTTTEIPLKPTRQNVSLRNLRLDYPSYHELEQERYLSNKHKCSRECIDGAEPLTCHYDFKVEWYHSMSKACYDCPFNISDCYRPDCVPTDGVKRPILVINRSIPGPAVEVCVGDTVIVDVENALMEESTSVHWHGHHQRGSPYMDGVPFVTQCPIPPKTTFRYTYTASTPGTHFWHSHSGCQRADGAFGAFIVRKPLSQEFHHNLYDLDLPEHTIVTLDWSHKLGIALFAAHHHADGDNKPKTIQVNGRGIYKTFKENGREVHTPPASFTVTKGFRYRFRLINAGVLNCPIELSIDNHTMTVISSDGSDIHPVEVDSLVSYAGERWDFILNADLRIGNYWMRFRGLMDCDERFTSAYQVAVLRYQGSDVSQDPPDVVTYENSIRKGLVLNELNAQLNDSSISVPELSSTDNDTDPTLKLLPDRKIVLSYDFHPIDNPYFNKPQLYGFFQVPRNTERVYTPQLNHISLKLPPFPLLSQPHDLKPDMLCNKHNLKKCNETYCECTNIIEINLGEVVEIILIDIGVTYDANHPFHLHGHPFRVISMDRIGKTVSPEKVLKLDSQGKIHRNLRSPPIKDTVTVPDGGYTIIRFQANNPGFWLFHCHIEFHVELGMALLFKVGKETDFPQVPQGFPTCGDFTPSQEPQVTQETDIPVHENEIDFRDGFWVYNVTNELGRKEHSIISVVHWWPLISNFQQRSSATAPCSFIQLNLIFIVILWMKQFYEGS